METQTFKTGKSGSECCNMPHAYIPSAPIRVSALNTIHHKRDSKEGGKFGVRKTEKERFCNVWY
eukprot:2596952-Rhodomonas_salina.1